MHDDEPANTGIMLPRYGSYQVLHPLGSGGMSSVFKAVHVETGHKVALKVLPLIKAGNPIGIKRFLREARSAEALQDPNIVSIYDRGVDKGRHYLVLEYVDGADLHEYVQSHGPLSVAEAIRVVRHVALGLAHAASRGLVHRDIKPSNILRSHTGEIKIADLGLALRAEFEDERITREGTTVGTIDYMAPEQARDSRAASHQSDLYSLGCTFYFLLTGIPPYPGGDIIDKLTRHARSAPRNVRDLRPDVPEALSRVMLRMMAKEPKDRFATFDELIAALDEIVLAPGQDTSPPFALVPPSSSDPDKAPLPPSPSKTQTADEYPVVRPPSSNPELSLASLSAEVMQELAPGPPARPAVQPPPAVLPRLRPSPGHARRERGGRAANRAPREDHALSTTGWVVLSVALGLAFVGSWLVIDRLVRTSPTEAGRMAPSPKLMGHLAAAPAIAEADRPTPRLIPKGSGAGDLSVVPGRQASSKPSPAPTRPEALPAVAVESEDANPPAQAPAYSEETIRHYLPSWATAPAPERVEGPLFRIRRVAASHEPGRAPSLRMALDETKGPVEIDELGPLVLSDFRIAGESRLVRARPGLRTILRIDRLIGDLSHESPGVIVLEGKSLILDALDLVVNMRELPAAQGALVNLRELPAAQGALFYCKGANLTVRNCTITLVNPTAKPFVLVHAEGTAGRGSRILFEKTFVRGAMDSAFDLAGGAVDIVTRETIIVGSQGPLVRQLHSDHRGEQQLASVGNVFACRGPALQLRHLADGEGPAPPEPHAAPLSVRAFDTIFGRFKGAGITSLISSNDSAAKARSELDWQGEHNLFCGWKGFFAQGAELTLSVPNLASFRSTWKLTDQKSTEIQAPWPQPPSLGNFLPDYLTPFVPGHEKTLSRSAVPSPFLEAKTIGSFTPPEVPVPRFLSELRGRATSISAIVPYRGHQAPIPREIWEVPAARTRAAEANPAVAEFLFDASGARFRGDMGAFLQETLAEKPVGQQVLKHMRVRVSGSGSHLFSPVRLPDDLVLEILVEAQQPAGNESEGITWSPVPEAKGRALIELHGGALLLSGVRLRSDQSATIESLIHVEGADLVLYRCQLAAPGASDASTPRLVSFSAVSTHPRGRAAESSLFATEPDRPVCLIIECTLVTTAGAIRSELGRGLIALEQTAVAAGTDALELLPARVARARFEADLVLDHCTLASEANIVRIGPWPDRSPGPQRPWLVTSRNSAFLGTYDRRVSDTVLLRADEEAMAQGAVFWQGAGDAVEVEAFTAAVGEPIVGRNRDVVRQWVNFWGGNHQRGVTGPRAATNQSSVRLLDRPRPGQVVPSDLILDPGYHPGRRQLDVGADLTRQGINRRPAPSGRRR